MIILAAASIAAIGSGLRQVMGLYLKPVSETLGFGREIFALAIAIANIVWGLAAPITGAVSDSFGSGRVAAFGAVMTTAGLLMLYAAQSEAQLLFSGVLLGLGVAGCGINAMVGAVARAVAPELRTRAIALIGIGAGVGILVAMPYAHLLMAVLGWQSSLLVLASTAASLLFFAALVRGKPQQVLGEGEAAQGVVAALREAFAHPSFWLLNAGFFVCGFHIVFYGTHLPAYVADKGFDPGVAVAALTMVGIGNLVGTYLAGEWGRRLPKRYGLSLIYLGRAGVFLAFLALPITPVTVIVLSGVLGVLWLSTVPLTSGLVSTFFGARWLTMLYGFVFLSHQVGAFLGAWLGGYLFDQLRSYDAMWWISVGLGVLAAALSWPIRERAARPIASLTTKPAG
ncbi:MAG: MFS transporter [Hyphomicrobiaceae bacterium]